MNYVSMMGRLTREPDIHQTGTTTIANFSMAIDRRFKRDGQPTADFFDFVAFGKTAEIVKKYLHKGTKMVIEGRLQNDNYTDRDGKTVYRNRIIVENMEFAESKKFASQPDPEPDENEFMNIPDGISEELPFN